MEKPAGARMDAKPDQRQEELRRLQQQARVRKSELEEAAAHIAGLETRLLELKKAKIEVARLRAAGRGRARWWKRLFGRAAPEADRPAPPEIAAYQAWLQRHRPGPERLEEMRQEAALFPFRPLLSIVTPVHNTPGALLRETAASVMAQVYPRWEWIVVDDGSSDDGTAEALAGLDDPRIRQERLAQSGGISTATNRALAEAQGEWVAFLDHDDLLEPDALFRVVELLQRERGADLLYSDEDKLGAHGLESPMLKPDWSPDYFLSYNYIAHLLVVRRALLEEVGGLREGFEGAQDYDLCLRLSEKTGRIHHLPHVLYHWRRREGSTSNNIRHKPGALEAGQRALREHLERTRVAGHVAIDWSTHAYRVRREIPVETRAAVIVHADEAPGEVEGFLAGLRGRSGPVPFEVIVTGSAAVLDRLNLAGHGQTAAALPFAGPKAGAFNLAVDRCAASLLLFCSALVRPLDEEWLFHMAEQATRPEVGAVGARLLTPGGEIHHAGVVFSVGTGVDHAFRGFPAAAPGAARQARITRNYSAVSGDCLLTRRDVFRSVRGFDGEMGAWADLDYCLRLRQAGHLVVSTPFARLTHLRPEAPRPDEEMLARMRVRWRSVWERDPYYHPNLSRERADFSLGN